MYEYPRGAWLVQARYPDGAPAFWNRFDTEDAAQAWAQAQRDALVPGDLRYSFDVSSQPYSLVTPTSEDSARGCK